MVRGVWWRGPGALSETTRFTSVLAGPNATSIKFALLVSVPTFLADGIIVTGDEVSDASTAGAYTYQASAVIRGHQYQPSVFILLAARRPAGAGLEVAPARLSAQCHRYLSFQKR
jgi:hypothetical protein